MITAPSLITNNDVKYVAKHDSKISQAHISATWKAPFLIKLWYNSSRETSLFPNFEKNFIFNTDFFRKITKYIQQNNVCCPKLMEQSPFAETPGVGLEIVNKSQNSKITKKVLKMKNLSIFVIIVFEHFFEWKPG